MNTELDIVTTFFLYKLLLLTTTYGNGVLFLAILENEYLVLSSITAVAADAFLATSSIPTYDCYDEYGHWEDSDYALCNM